MQTMRTDSTRLFQCFAGPNTQKSRRLSCHADLPGKVGDSRIDSVIVGSYDDPTEKLSMDGDLAQRVIREPDSLFDGAAQT